MSPDERATKLVDEHFPDVQGRAMIAAAIQEAVDAERERCARVAEAVAAENDDIAERTTSSVSTAVLHGLADAARIVAERIREAGDAVADAADPQHPRQPVVRDATGVERFKANQIVRFLLDWAKPRGMNLNELATMSFTDEDRRQFAQLIGYSVSGYGDLSYAYGGTR